MPGTDQQWSEKQAVDWYAAQPWMVGCNYLPATACNQLEMWQQETFDPRTIDKELKWAAALGFNPLRVFLHDIFRPDGTPFNRVETEFIKNITSTPASTVGAGNGRWTWICPVSFNPDAPPARKAKAGTGSIETHASSHRPPVRPTGVFNDLHHNSAWTNTNDMHITNQMKSTMLPLAILLGFALISSPETGCAEPTGGSAWDRAVADPAAAKLARPDAVQYAWHEQERIMFICLDPCTWQSREYDNHTTKLSEMKLEKLDVAQWMTAAEAWGAKEIMLVCKHTGGFCWWPTTTTDYCVMNIPWKQGQGNLVKEVAEACRKHGLKVGVYIYSDDPKYMANMGQGGKTDDPAKQEEWNRLLRQQWTEVLTIYGKDLVREIWFDGSCIVPLDDIIRKLAPNAVVLQSPMTNIRWVGNEAGIASDPNWNTLKSADLKTGVATQAHSTPDGDVWAPVECDTTLYDHFWFWSEGNEKNTCKSLDALLQRYVQSVGHGSVLLLNSTPNTAGLIPERDMKLYQEFGTALKQNFGQPAGKLEKSAGSEAIVELGQEKPVNCIDLWEAYEYGHRIRAYQVDAWVNGGWKRLAVGTAIGRRKMDLFPEITTSKLRVNVTEQVGTPLFRQILAHRVSPSLVQALGSLPSVSRSASITASSFHSPPYEAKYLIDGNPNTRWGTDIQDPLAWVELDLHRSRRFASLAANELADRIREFQISVRNRPQDPWRVLFTGNRIGNDFKTDLPATTARFVRFQVTKIDGPAPTLWELSLADRPDAWETAATLELTEGEQTLDIDLSAQITDPGQYEIRFEGAAVIPARPLFEGQPGEARFLEKLDANTWRLNRTQAVAEGSTTGLRLTLNSALHSKLNVLISPR